MTHCSWGDIKASSGHTLLLEKGITCPKCTVKFLIISGHISHASELPIIDPDPWESFHLSLNPASGLGSISTFTFLVKKDITFYWLETFFFSKWPEAFALPSCDAITIAQVLYKDIFTRYGSPIVIITDHSQCFISHLVKSLYALIGVKLNTTSPYHPASNCERVNSQINRSLHTYVKDN